MPDIGICRQMKRKGVKKEMKQEMLKEIEASILPEIYVCQSALVEEALKKEFFSWDDVENLYRPFDGLLLSPTVCYSCKLRFDCLDSETGLCASCYEETLEPQEIFEWWLVSAWLAEKLQNKGEPILENTYGIWWGRCISGQAIAMDFIIQEIYDEVIGDRE